jgi:hypothetical protein
MNVIAIPSTLAVRNHHVVQFAGISYGSPFEAVHQLIAGVLFSKARPLTSNRK